MGSPENVRNPKIWPVSLSENSAKIRKSTDRNHKLINSEGGQDTSAYKISGYSLHAFSGKCHESPNLTCFTEVKIVPKFEKSTDRDHMLINSEGGQDTSACKISGYSLHAFSEKCPETPNLTRFIKSKWRQTKENQQTVTII